MHSQGARRSMADGVAIRGSPETKDPSGGTAGRVKPYGAWGGWALAPNMASIGRNSRSHSYSVLRGRLSVQSASGFFWVAELLRIIAPPSHWPPRQLAFPTPRRAGLPAALRQPTLLQQPRRPLRAARTGRHDRE